MLEQPYIGSNVYPKIIFGEDSFTGWFGKNKELEEPRRAILYRAALNEAYLQGVRGFSISPQATLVQVLIEFYSEHPDIICIANYHWFCNYYLDGVSLWNNDVLMKINKRTVEIVSNKYYIDNKWIDSYQASIGSISDEEIGKIYLDEEEYHKNAKFLKAFCKYAIVGNYGFNSLQVIGRGDIVERECAILRKAGIIPIGICEGGAIGIDHMRSLDIDILWVWVNRYRGFPNKSATENEIITSCKNKKIITAFRIFEHDPNGDINIVASIQYIAKLPNIQSILFGADNEMQIKETMGFINKYYLQIKDKI